MVRYTVETFFVNKFAFVCFVSLYTSFHSASNVRGQVLSPVRVFGPVLAYCHAALAASVQVIHRLQGDHLLPTLVWNYKQMLVCSLLRFYFGQLVPSAFFGYQSEYMACGI